MTRAVGFAAILNPAPHYGYTFRAHLPRVQRRI
jgi:hypothetical protein